MSKTKHSYVEPFRILDIKLPVDEGSDIVLENQGIELWEFDLIERVDKIVATKRVRVFPDIKSNQDIAYYAILLAWYASPLARFSNMTIKIAEAKKRLGSRVNKISDDNIWLRAGSRARVYFDNLLSFQQHFAYENAVKTSLLVSMTMNRYEEALYEKDKPVSLKELSDMLSTLNEEGSKLDARFNEIFKVKLINVDILDAVSVVNKDSVSSGSSSPSSGVL